jgi:hypothetical protein
MLESKELGELGETYFKNLCAQVPISATKPGTDEHGWDFYCELPLDNVYDCDLDCLQTPIKFKVQVKSTYYKDKKNSVKVKLSALQKFIISPEPCFFCFVEYDTRDQSQPLNVYVLHVEETIIAGVLTRIRKIQESKGKDVKLNNEERAINYKNALKLRNFNGSELYEAIKQYIPNGLDEYIKNKQEILKTIGYEDGKVEFNIQVDTEGYSIMTDQMLGVESKEIPLASFLRFTKRFNILLKDEESPSLDTRVTMQIYPPHLNGEIVFKHSDLSNEISFSAKMFTWLDEKSFRIESDFFELIDQPSKELDFKININFDIRYRIKDLINIAKFMSLLCEDQHFSVGFNATSESLRRSSDYVETSEIEEKYINLLSVVPTMRDTIAKDVEHWLNVSDHLKKISALANNYNIPIDSILLSFDELMDKDNCVDHMLNLENLCGQNIGLNVSNLLELEDRQEVIVIWPLICKIGNYFFTKKLQVKSIVLDTPSPKNFICKVIESKNIQSKFYEEKKASELTKFIESIRNMNHEESSFFTPLLISSKMEKEIFGDDHTAR